MTLFLTLQMLDLISTLLVLAHGGQELNPVVRAFMPYVGRVAAVLISKAALTGVIWTFARRKKRLLILADAIYTGVVIWNVLILSAMSSNPHPTL
jgi:hypothetical protein